MTEICSLSLTAVAGALQKKEISQGTAKAIEAISSFLSLLANYYDKERKGELKLDND